MNARSALYKAARLLGDVRAVRRGKVGDRIYNRVVGKLAGRLMGKVWRR